MSGHPIGFDRRIRLEWLDVAAAAVADGLDPDEVRALLTKELSGQVAGSAFNSAMGKTKTVLVHVWVEVPEKLEPLRELGVALLADAAPRDRLPVHWGMCLATYPFFNGVARTLGRLLQLQGDASLAEATQRLRETWGDRSTLDRATQRVARTMVDWGVLVDAGSKGGILASEDLPYDLEGRLAAWLMAAAAFGARQGTVPFASLRSSPALFPFRLRTTPTELDCMPGLRVVREGVDQHVVAVDVEGWSA